MPTSKLKPAMLEQKLRIDNGHYDPDLRPDAVNQLISRGKMDGLDENEISELLLYWSAKYRVLI